MKFKFMLFRLPQQKITPPKLYNNGILIDYVTVFNFVGKTIQININGILK